jgi:hypothetical protein
MAGVRLQVAMYSRPFRKRLIFIAQTVGNQSQTLILLILIAQLTNDRAERRFDSQPAFLRRTRMFDPREKIALFIDGANLYATSRALAFDIDYRKLLTAFQKRGYLLRAYYYTALVEDQEYSSIRPLIDWLDYNGYHVVTKSAKEFTDATGRRKIKGNMDIELAIDALELAE